MSLRNFLRRTQMLIQHGLYVTRNHSADAFERPLEFSRLEERILFSGSPVAPIAAEIAEAGSALAAALTVPEADSSGSGLFPLSDQQMLDLVADTLLPSAQASGSASAASGDDTQTLELVFIDSSISNSQQLITDLQALAVNEPSRALNFILLDTEDDGIAQITSVLNQHSRIDGIHIVSHGDAGRIQLGSTTLSLNTLEQYRHSIAAWQSSMSEDADILLYGCSLAASAEGIQLLSELSQLTASDVAASEDLTGHADLGGDWDLEHQIGSIESQLITAEELDPDWFGLLELTPAGGETLVNGSTLNAQQLSQDTGGHVAMDSSGRYVVTWYDDRSGNPDVYARVFNADGTTRVGEFKVHANRASVQDWASVAMADSGNFVVTWSDNRTGMYEVYMRLFDVDGVALTGETQVSTLSQPQDYHAVEFAADGSFVVVFQNSADTDIYIQRYNSSGIAQGVNTRVNQTTTGTQNHPDVAIRNDGIIILTWTDSENDGAGAGVYARAFSADGVPLNNQYQVNVATAGDQMYSSIAVDAAGNTVIVWTSDLQDGSGLGIYMRRFDSAGNPLTGDVLVNSTTAGNQEHPHVDMKSTGEFIITWQDDALDGSGLGIFAREYDSAGNPVAGAFQVNTTASNNQTTPSVAFAGNSAVIVWMGEGPGDADGIFIQRYDLTTQYSITVTTASDTLDGDTSSIAALIASRGADGQISLREAIAASNNTIPGLGGPNLINFGIGSGAQTITISGSDLAAITRTVIIDGTTQSGYSGTPLISIIDGDGRTIGLSLEGNSSGSTIRGLNIQGFGVAGINITSSGNTIAGNYIGTNAAGTTSAGNFDGIKVWGGENNVIGGTAAADRNIISGNTNNGIHIDGEATDGNSIQNNWIGLASDGTTVLGNGNNGIYITGGADNTTIGGIGLGNVIMGSGRIGIEIFGASTGTSIVGNLLGINPNGTSVSGSMESGIYLTSGAADTTIGGTSVGEGNVITDSGRGGLFGSGIYVDTTAGTGNQIAGNSIYGNAQLGINLGANGVTANDSLDGDSPAAANTLQNFPVIVSAVVDAPGTTTTVSGTLNTLASISGVVLHFYASAPTGDLARREGRKYLGSSSSLTTDAAGNLTFSNLALTGYAGSVAVGDVITATATYAGNTSEFSQGFIATASSGNVAPAELQANLTSGGGLSLNQGAGNGTYLLARNGSSIFGGRSAFTAEVRFSTDGFASETNFLSYALGTNDDEMRLFVMGNGNLGFTVDGATQISAAMDYRLLADGDSHSLAVSWTSAGGEWRVYVDGLQVDAGSGLKIGATLGSSGQLVVGMDQNQPDGGYEPNKAFTGTLHDIRIFSDVRTASEIAANYHSEIPRTESGLLVNWKFLDLSAAGVTTDSVSGNHLTVKQATGSGFTADTPELTFSIRENAAASTVVGSVVGLDADRESKITALLAANPSLVYSREFGKFYQVTSGAVDRHAASSTAGASLLNTVAGGLPTIRSAAENELVRGLISGTGLSTVWLSGSDIATPDVWRWSDGTQFWQGGAAGHPVNGAFANFSAGQPSGENGTIAYLSMNNAGKWNDSSAFLMNTALIIEWNADEVLDATHSLTYSLTSQTVSGAFHVDADSGLITVADPSLLDHETTPVHSLTVQVSDGAATFERVFTVSLTDATVELSNSVPALQTTDEDTDLVFSAANGNAVSVTDQDPGSDRLLQVSLSVPSGTLTLSQTTGLSFPGGSNGSGGMVIFGRESDINAALDGLTFSPPLNFSGSVNLSIETSLAAGLEGWYTFDDGTASDQSVGILQNGTLVGNATTATDATRGTVLVLDGVGDSVTIPGTFGNPTSITIGGWVNLNTGSARAEFISLNERVSLSLDDATHGIKGSIQTSPGIWQDLTTQRFIAGTGWHHVMYVFDDITDTHNLYIDGQLAATGVISSSIDWSGATATVIGDHPAGLYPMNGRIDDVRIYTRSLSADEVAALAADGGVASSSVTIQVTAVNDAPVLDSAASPSLPSISEDVLNPAGVEVFDLIVDGSLTDDDGVPVEAIALTAANANLGTWQYSLDGGTSWRNVHIELINSQTSEHALLLAPTAMLRLLPATDLSGTWNDAITFRAWDMTEGSSGSYTLISAAGGTSSLSAASDTAAITISPVNDAPDFDSGPGFLVFSVPGSTSSIFNSTVIQPDGKILAVGKAVISGQDDLLVARFHADGSLDTTFAGGAGYFVSGNSGYSDSGQDVLLLSDGGILVAGFGGVSPATDTILVKFTADGILDANFGTGGLAVSSIPGIDQGMSAVELPDGRIVVSGTTGSNFFFTRFLSNGTRDNTFGVGGQMTVDWASGTDQSLGLVVQPDGKLIATGVAWTGSSFDVALVRLNADGTLDSTFGSGGRVNTDVGTDTNDRGTAIQLQADGKIVVAGWGNAAGTNDFYLLRYNADGTLDLSFGGGDGRVVTSVSSGGTFNDFALSLGIQSDGKILTGGYSNNNSNNFTVIRYNTDGTLDSSFGTGGIADVHFGGTSDDRGNGLAIQKDGRIVVVGSSTLSGSTSGAIVRLTPDGTLDDRFAHTSSLGGSVNYTEGGSAVVLDSNVTVFDPELAAQGHYEGAFLWLRRSGGGHADDVFSSSGNLSTLTQGGNITISGNNVGVVSSIASGNLILTFNSNATSLLVNEVLRSIAYSNLSETPPASVSLLWEFYDGNTGLQGTGGQLTTTGETTVFINPTNDPPLLTQATGGGTYYENNDGVYIDITTAISDSDSPDFDGGTLTFTISGNGEATDRLIVRAGSGVTLLGNDVYYDSGSGPILTASFSGGIGHTSPLLITFNANSDDASVEAIARQVAFLSISDNPSGLQRTVTTQFTDGDGGTSNTDTRVVNVIPVNDPPVNLLPVAQTVAEDGVLTLSAASGNNIAINTVDEGTAVMRITLTASNGTLTLAQTAGLTFIEGDGTADATMTFEATNTSIYSALDGLTFTPDPDFHGLATITVVSDDLGSTGTGGAQSDTDILTVTVTPVNDAPVVGGATLAAAAEDSVNPPGATINDLFSGTFSDIDPGASLAGVLITHNPQNSSQGSWQYSTDAGTTWHDVAAIVGTDSLALDANSLIRFLPAENYFGPVDVLSLRALDDSYPGTFTSGASRVTFDSSSPGGTSSISSSLVSISTSISPVNDDAAISLDPDNSGGGPDDGNFEVSFIEGDSPVLVTDSDATVYDFGEGDVESLLILTSGFADGNFERFTIGGQSFTWGQNRTRAITVGATTFTVTFENTVNSFLIANQAGGNVPVTDLNALIRTITYENTDNNPTLGDRFLQFLVHEPGGVITGSATSTISVSAVNNAPVLVTNSLTIAEEESRVLSVTEINATDVDSPAASLTFTATNIAHGQFERTSQPGISITSFTQAEINSGLIRFVHDGGELAPSYDLAVSDGILSDGPVSTTVTFTNVNDEQTFVPGIGQSFYENSMGNVVSRDTLNTMDPDHPDSQLVYTLTTVTTNGTLRLNGLALSNGATFTQEDVNAGFLTYDHDGSETNSDSFTFSVDDGVGADSGVLVSFTILPVNDNAPVIISNGGGPATSVSIAENTFLVTTATASDADFPSNPLTWSLAGGDDSALFVIHSVSGELRFFSAPDFEMPADFDGNNVYEVIVQVSDGLFFTTQQISVTITDVSSQFLVTTTADLDDSGLGGSYTIEELHAVNGGADGLISLREALTAANNTPGIDTVTFSIAGAGVHTIVLTSALPEITDSIIIDGWSEPDFAGTPVIQLDGSLVGSSVDGLRISAGNSTIRGLIISSFTGNGIALTGAGNNVIVGNWIGLDATGAAAGNVTGLYVVSSGNQIGGSTPAERNVISGNTDAGIVVSGVLSSGNTILGNIISSGAGLGIDLEGDGLTANDQDDLDSGANRLTNFPVLTVASKSGDNTRIEGTLQAESSTSYRVEIFAGSIGNAHPSGHGPADRYLGFVNVTTDTNGFAAFAVNLPAVVSIGETVTATATDSAGNTSEFSLNREVIGPIPLLDLDADDSSGETGSDYAATFVEDGGPVNIADTDAVAWDPDTTTLTKMTVTITNLLDGSDELLTADISGTPLISSYSGGILTIAGVANEQLYEQVLRTIAYANLSENANSTTRILVITIEDGVFTSSPAVSRIQILNVNDAPVIRNNTLTISEGGTALLSSADLLAEDPEQSDSELVFSVSGVTGGRFELVSSPGQAVFSFTQADINASRVQFVHDGDEAPPSYAVTVSDGSLQNGPQAVTVSFTNSNDSPVMNAGSFSLPENSSLGTSVGFVTSTDPDAGDTASYSIVGGNPAGAFGVNAGTGELIVLNPAELDYETQPVFHLTIRVHDAEGAFSDAVVTVSLLNVNEDAVTAVIDVDGLADVVSEDSVTGTYTGITAFAYDPDSTDTVNYSLHDDAGGRFAIDAVTGIVTVADGSLLNFESASQHSIVVRATSTDGSTSQQSFTIQLLDVNEGGVSAITDLNSLPDAIQENAADGTPVGYTAFASDPDGTDNLVTYSLIDNAGGRFSIDGTTGVVAVADGTLLDREVNDHHTIVIRAISSDGSMSSQTVHILVHDVNESPVSAAVDTDPSTSLVAENAPPGTSTGITVFAFDEDATTNTITYSLDDSAGGRFQINSTTGVVTVGTTPLDFESTPFHTITARATSADGSFSTLTLNIDLTDFNESGVSAIVDDDPAVNAVSENAASGTSTGILAAANDADGTDTVTYSLDDNAGGRFQIDAITGVISVLDGSLLDYEDSTGHSVTVRATSSDGSFGTRVFTIAVLDQDEFDVSPISDTDAAPESVSENSASGTPVGLTVYAVDNDGTSNTVTYSLDDDAGGRFSVNASTGTVRVANGLLLDHETSTSHSITVRATSADGSFTTRAFTIAVNDVNEFTVSPVTDIGPAVNEVAENANTGTSTGLTAFASDPDGTSQTVTYSLTNDAGGRFMVDSVSGRVTVADGTLLDRESAAAHTITVRADSQDGSFSLQTFTIALTDVDEFNVAPVTDSDASVNRVNENATAGTPVGITASSFDADATTNAIVYSLDDNAGGRFSIDSTTGIVRVSDSSLLDYEQSTGHVIRVRATSADGSATARYFSVAVADVNDSVPVILPGQQLMVSELAVVGSIVGDVVADDADSVGSLQGWMITGGNSDNVFRIDPGTGRITVADPARLNYEINPSYLLQVSVSDGVSRSAVQTVEIRVLDEDEAPLFSPVASPEIAENTAAGTIVASLLATDQDGGDSLTYLILNSSTPGAFTVDTFTGAIQVLDSSLLNFEVRTSVTLMVEVRDLAGMTDTQQVIIRLNDVNERPEDLQIVGGFVAENSGQGAYVGRLTGVDPDFAERFQYSLVDDADGRFQVNAVSGIITVSAGAVLNYEEQRTFHVVALVEDQFGLTLQKAFTLQLTDVNDRPVATEDEVQGIQVAAIEVLAPGILLNDYDEDGDELRAVLVAPTTNGVLVFRDNGSFLYAPISFFFGKDTFSYYVTDGLLVSDVVTVTIDVAAAVSPGGSGSGSAGGSSGGAAGSGGDSGSGTGSTGENSNSTLTIVTADQFLVSPTVREQRVGGTAASASANEIETADSGTVTADPLTLNISSEQLVAAFAPESLEISRSERPRSAQLEVIVSTVFGPVSTRFQQTDTLLAHDFFTIEQLTENTETLDPLQSFDFSEKVAVGSAAVVSTSLSVGYVIWILRGGSLLTTFMSALPVWQTFDPLPVLQSFAKDTDRDDEDEDTLLSIATRRLSGKKNVK